MPAQVDLEKIGNSIPARESKKKKLLRNALLTAFYKRVWWAPIAFGVLLQFTIYGALVIAFSQQQLERWLPYVSDVGTKHPQASYFCMLLALCSLLMIISTYFRYSQVQYYLSNVLPLRSTQTPQSYNRNNNNNNKPEKEAKYSHDHAHQINFLYNVNFQSMLIGYGVAVGVLMIGSFRMGEYFFHHLTGCSLGVFGGGVSMIYQIALIHLLNKQQVDHRLERSPRLLTILALVAMTSLALLSLFALILMYEVGFYNFVDMNFRHRWSPEVEGYELHACSALLEWIALACLSMGCIDMGWRMRRFGREFPGWLQARKEKLVRISSVSMACRDPEVYSISNVWNL